MDDKVCCARHIVPRTPSKITDTNLNSVFVVEDSFSHGSMIVKKPTEHN